MPKPQFYYRSIFISDVHLGAAGCKTSQVHEFLRVAQSDYLYLVGDIIDGWVIRKSGKWTQAHTDVVGTLLDKTKRGVIVRYTPGNHDAFLRRVDGFSLGNIAIANSFVHVTADGRRMLITHGDSFDKYVTKMRPVAFLGAWVYEFVTVTNRRVNDVRARFGWEPIDFCCGLKTRVKALIKRFSNHEEALVESATAEGCDGVICGHVHRPTVDVAPGSPCYLNTGDWVEHCTAVVEHYNGELELVSWSDLERELSACAVEPSAASPFLM